MRGTVLTLSKARSNLTPFRTCHRQPGGGYPRGGFVPGGGYPREDDPRRYYLILDFSDKVITDEGIPGEAVLKKRKSGS